MYSRGEPALLHSSTIELATVFGLARRFEMDDLSVLIYPEFELVVTYGWAIHPATIGTKELVALIQFIYDTSPSEETKGLRKVLASCVAVQAAYLMENHLKVLEQAFGTSTAFALDVFRAEKGWEIP